jgi:uncharacterized protein YbjT (DUF2867 family)
MHDDETENLPKVAIAGATGFVGQAMLACEQKSFSIVGLTRGSILGRPSRPNTEWRKCDLFSLSETRKALEGCDYAVYLVHSMLPAAQLTQANFADLDILVADNFARAAYAAGVKQIVYVGGIIPPDTELSGHLKSRFEVEKALAGQGTPVTALRAAMIFGPTGSSMNVLLRLVKRLPVMICPSWTGKKSQPVFIGDVVEAVFHCLGREGCRSQVYDLGGTTALSYREMMRRVGRHNGKEPIICGIPLITPKLSRLWVSFVTGAPKNLIEPLIESLQHDMLPAQNRRLAIPDHEFLSFDEILDRSLGEGDTAIQPRAFQLPPDEQSQRTVRSVQRLSMPKGYKVKEIALEYLRWLPKFLAPFLRVEVEEHACRIYFAFLKKALLVLELDDEEASSDRESFLITGGILVDPRDVGRFEFRRIESSDCLIAAIHDFHPRLPWYLYIYSQALVHLWVMRGFGEHLKRLSGKE